MNKEEAIEIIKETRFDINTKINGTTRFSQALEIAIDALERDETVTEFADRCKECGARYGKLLKQKSDKWIPASEPPKTNGRYLTRIKNGPFSYMMVCDYIQQTWCPDDETVSNDVTHWMPLPVEPYEEVKNE